MQEITQRLFHKKDLAPIMVDSGGQNHEVEVIKRVSVNLALICGSLT